VQGYHFAKPLAADDFSDWIQQFMIAQTSSIKNPETS
jgi:EAL domain-containing protein (putative c-di-GMP-specific phosphodiesterase class I)